VHGGALAVFGHLVALYMQATASNPMYQLQAFPTLLVLKDFTPYRGIILSSDIELSNPNDNYLLSPFLTKDSEVQIDTTPVLKRIAKEWNYDLALLKEGNGDTGVAGHSWTTYAQLKSTPQIIRWKQGSAQIIMSIGARSGCMQHIVIGNKDAIPTLDKLNELFGSTPRHSARNVEVTTEMGNQLVKNIVQTYSGDNHFNTHCTIVVSDNGKLSTQRSKDYVRLLNSTNLSLRRAGQVKLCDGEKPDSVMMVEIPDIKIKSKYSAQEEISRDMLEIIYGQSVIRSHGFMTHMLSECLVPDYGANMYTAPDDYNVEDLERTRSLDLHTKMLTDSPHRADKPFWSNISLSLNFTEPGVMVLRGTAGEIKPFHHSDSNPTTEDLLSYLVTNLLCPKLELISETLDSEDDSKLKATLKPGKELLAAMEEMPGRRKQKCYAKLEAISNPYFSVHMGMPVRVDQSVTVWRETDTKALACDVWYDLETRHLHVANLYRIKVPTA